MYRNIIESPFMSSTPPLDYEFFAFITSLIALVVGGVAALFNNRVRRETSDAVQSNDIANLRNYVENVDSGLQELRKDVHDEIGQIRTDLNNYREKQGELKGNVNSLSKQVTEALRLVFAVKNGTPLNVDATTDN